MGCKMQPLRMVQLHDPVHRFQSGMVLITKNKCLSFAAHVIIRHCLSFYLISSFIT